MTTIRSETFNKKKLDKFVESCIDDFTLYKFYYSTKKLKEDGTIDTVTSTNDAKLYETFLTTQQKDHEKIDDWQYYIQNLIFALYGHNMRDRNRNKKRKRIISMLQKLNDVSLWDRFKNTFFTANTSIDEGNSDTIVENKVMTIRSVPNMMTIIDDEDNIDKNAMTAKTIETQTIFPGGPYDMFAQGFNNVEERMLAWSILANADDSRKKQLDELSKHIGKTSKKRIYTNFHPRTKKQQLNQHRTKLSHGRKTKGKK